MIRFTNQERAGLLPLFFSSNDMRPAAEQLHENYAHGGGFHPFEGFQLLDRHLPNKAQLAYPEDPPMRELSRGTLRDELLIFFESSWLAIVQPDGGFVVTRVD